MVLVVQHVVARLADRNVELVVGPDGDELPAVRLVLRQVRVDHRRLGRVVENVLDVVDLGDLRQLGDVERAVVIGEPVRPIEPGGDRLELGLAVLLDDGGDLVAEAGADEHGALVADAQRARIGDAAGIDLDVEAGRQLELGGRQLVGRRPAAAAAATGASLAAAALPSGRPISGEPGGRAARGRGWERRRGSRRQRGAAVVGRSRRGGRRSRSRRACRRAAMLRRTRDTRNHRSPP